LEQLDLGWAERASGTGRRCSPAKAGKPAAGFLQIKDNRLSITSYFTGLSNGLKDSNKNLVALVLLI
jgi:hypothetical protein